ncbi:hypothetical protein HDV00_010528, partial [Rhizophlyctis rosea]
MPLIYNPLTNTNIRTGSKPYTRMMKAIMSGNFSRKHWTRDRREALEDIMVEHLPLFIAQQQEKRQTAARQAVVTRRARGTHITAAQKAAQTRQRKKQEEDQRVAAAVAAAAERRKEGARKAAETKKRNREEGAAAAARVAEMLEDYFDNKEVSEVDISQSIIDEERWDMVRDVVKDLKLKPKTRYDILIKCTVTEGVELQNGGVFAVPGFAERIIEDTDFARNVLGRDVVAKVIDFFLHMEGGYSVYEIRNLDIQASPSRDRPGRRELQKEIMAAVGRKEKSVILDVPYVDQNMTEDGTCGWVMSETHFRISRRTLKKILRMEDEFAGLTNQNQAETCDDRRAGIIVVGLDGKVMYKKSVDKSVRDHHQKTLIYVFSNGHFYPITDNSLRRSLMQKKDTMEKCLKCGMERAFDFNREYCIICGDSQWDMVDADEKEDAMVSLVSEKVKDVITDAIVVDAITPDDGVDLMEKYEGLTDGEKATVIVKSGDLQDLLIGMLTQHNILADNRSITLAKIMFTEGTVERHRLGIAKIRYGNVIFQRNQDYDQVIDASRVFHLPFTGQSVMGMILEYFQTSCPDAASSFNDVSKGWFANTQLAITKVFRRGEYDGDIAAIDLTRTYENAARMKQTPWAVIHSMDYPEPYVEQDVLRPIKYYVTFAPLEEQPAWFNMIPFNDGSYYHEFLMKLRHFGKTFNVVYKAYPDQIAKDNIRKFIGMLNKRVRRKYETTYSTSEVDLHQKYLGLGFIRDVGEGVFQGFSFKDSILQENYVPLYQQIIEMSWISMIKMARVIPVPHWIMIKTDELVYFNMNQELKEIKYGNRPVPYKTEEITQVKRDKLKLFEDRCPASRSAEPQPIIEPMEWNLQKNEIWTDFHYEELIAMGSFAVIGEGGTAKSFITKKLVEKLGDSVLLTSSTHVTAIGIRGETVHSGLRYDKATKRFMRSIDSSFTHVVIDEALMLDRDVLRALYWFKKHNKDVHIILLGDPTQLPPVMHRIHGMTYDISMNRMFMEICDRKRFSLVKNFRNPELTELYKKVGNLDFPDLVGRVVDTKLHIVFDNYRRRKLGHKVAKEECKKLKRKPVTVQTKNGDFIIFRSMKVYANETHKGLNIVNKESFTVKSAQAEDGTFSLKSDLRGHTIQLAPDVIAAKFEYSYARTVYGVQGVTIDEPYTIHRWGKLIYNDKVVAVGRARQTGHINICPGCDICKAKVRFTTTGEQELNEKWENASLKDKKELSLEIINKILRGKASDEFSQLYT